MSIAIERTVKGTRYLIETQYVADRAIVFYNAIDCEGNDTNEYYVTYWCQDKPATITEAIAIVENDIDARNKCQPKQG